MNTNKSCRLTFSVWSQGFQMLSADHQHGDRDDQTTDCNLVHLGLAEN